MKIWKIVFDEWNRQYIIYFMPPPNSTKNKSPQEVIEINGMTKTISAPEPPKSHYVYQKKDFSLKQQELTDLFENVLRDEKIFLSPKQNYFENFELQPRPTDSIVPQPIVWLSKISSESTQQLIHAIHERYLLKDKVASTEHSDITSSDLIGIPPSLK